MVYEKGSSNSKYETDKYGRLKPTPAQIKLGNVQLPEITAKIKDQILLVEKENNYS
jgi:hypothetical protein